MPADVRVIRAVGRVAAASSSSAASRRGVANRVRGEAKQAVDGVAAVERGVSERLLTHWRAIHVDGQPRCRDWPPALVHHTQMVPAAAREREGQPTARDALVGSRLHTELSHASPRVAQVRGGKRLLVDGLQLVQREERLLNFTRVSRRLLLLLLRPFLVLLPTPPVVPALVVMSLAWGCAQLRTAHPAPDRVALRGRPRALLRSDRQRLRPGAQPAVCHRGAHGASGG